MGFEAGRRFDLGNVGFEAVIIIRKIVHVSGFYNNGMW